MTHRTEINDYEVSKWLEETKWPTHEQDIKAMGKIYDKWLSTSPRCKYTGSLDEDLLIKMTIDRMKELHPVQKDACIISSILIMQAANIARRDCSFQSHLHNSYLH
tara:strand:+ start:1155 stop:1472 length:318 start_codon:yes stop_codon:yes gene_type:complete